MKSYWDLPSIFGSICCVYSLQLVVILSKQLFHWIIGVRIGHIRAVVPTPLSVLARGVSNCQQFPVWRFISNVSSPETKTIAFSVKFNHNIQASGNILWNSMFQIIFKTPSKVSFQINAATPFVRFSRSWMYVFLQDYIII